MARSYKMTVNDTGDPEEVRARTVCRTILFGEDEAVTGWPTVSWQFRRGAADDWIGKTAGTKQGFNRPDGGSWQPNDLVAQVQVTSGEGSSTFAQHEE